jgi:hypothetical protein
MKLAFARIAPILIGLLLAAPTLARAQDGYINIRVVNHGAYDARVALVDNICNRLVLEKRIVADAELPAQVCARGMDRGDVTIRNLETGAEQRHRDLLDGDQVPTP